MTIRVDLELAELHADWSGAFSYPPYLLPDPEWVGGPAGPAEDADGFLHDEDGELITIDPGSGDQYAQYSNGAALLGDDDDATYGQVHYGGGMKANEFYFPREHPSGNEDQERALGWPNRPAYPPGDVDHGNWDEVGYRIDMTTPTTGPILPEAVTVHFRYSLTGNAEADELDNYLLSVGCFGSGNIGHFFDEVISDGTITDVAYTFVQADLGDGGDGGPPPTIASIFDEGLPIHWGVGGAHWADADYQELHPFGERLSEFRLYEFWVEIEADDSLVIIIPTPAYISPGLSGSTGDAGVQFN